MRRLIVLGLVQLLISGAADAAGDVEQGRLLYRRACAVCHSLKPDVNMTGPSLAGLWRRKAGSLASFRRCASNSGQGWQVTVHR
jgi:cytochrome c